MLSLVLAPLFIVGFGIGAILYEIATGIEDIRNEQYKKECAKCTKYTDATAARVAELEKHWKELDLAAKEKYKDYYERQRKNVHRNIKW